MKKRSPRVSNFIASAICFALAFACVAPIWIVHPKGLVLVVMFFAGIGFGLMALQLFVNAVFRKRKTTGEVVESSISDAIIAIFR